MLPGLASTPREAALEDRGFVLDGLAEFWAAAAAAAKVARFCSCRALIPGERSQRGWCQTWAARRRRGWTGACLQTLVLRVFVLCDECAACEDKHAAADSANKSQMCLEEQLLSLGLLLFSQAEIIACISTNFDFFFFCVSKNTLLRFKNSPSLLE